MLIGTGLRVGFQDDVAHATAPQCAVYPGPVVPAECRGRSSLICSMPRSCLERLTESARSYFRNMLMVSNRETSSSVKPLSPTQSSKLIINRPVGKSIGFDLAGQRVNGVQPHRQYCGVGPLLLTSRASPPRWTCRRRVHPYRRAQFISAFQTSADECQGQDRSNHQQPQRKRPLHLCNRHILACHDHGAGDRRSGGTSGPASNLTITGIEPEWHVHSIEWDRAHLVEQAL
jgi:hypothetical protein